jgi:hypothetical protein
LVVDRHGIPLGITLTAGQKLECHTCPQLLDAVAVPRARGGRPRRRPRVVVGDKGYNAKGLIEYFKTRGIRTVIPRYANQKVDPTSITIPTVSGMSLSDALVGSKTTVASQLALKNTP